MTIVMHTTRSRKKPIGKLTSALALIAVLVIPCVPVLAQTSPTPAPTPTVSDDEVNRIAKGLYCPVCQNVPLEVCETEACSRWREQVRELIAQGESEQQIRDYFVLHFGAQTVGVPTNSTAQLLTVILPFALIALVLAVIAYNLLVWRRRQAAARAPGDAASAQSSRAAHDEYRARLEEDLRKRE